MTFAILFALFAWWFSTGIILFIDQLPRRTHLVSGFLVTLVAGAAFFGLGWAAGETSSLGVYLAFVCALVVWAWHELTFLLGWVTGPRRSPCPPGLNGWPRFRAATEVVIHHELAIALTALIVIALGWGGPNQVGAWTFGVLWVMRISAKLNVFLGVRNLTEEFIPAHLEYMKSYFRRRRSNPLMPISITAAVGTVVLLLRSNLGVETTEAARIGTTLVATMLGLAALEHLLLVLPVPDALLWRWALKAAELRGGAAPVVPAPRPPA